MTTGLIIGKFMPIHQGHCYLIDTARKEVDRLTVILFSKQAEPIDGALRFEWLRSLYPELDLHHLTDEHPVDYEDESVWQRWVKTIRRVLPSGPDVVFSSEEYGAELARRLEARHRLVDLDRQVVPVSGTLVREDPLAQWEHLPLPVRLHYLRRVAIIGPESSGKTTLARQLAERYQTTWVPEFAREYLLARGGLCRLEDIEAIASGHAAAEEQSAQVANRWLFVDTEVRTTRLWSRFYFRQCPDSVEKLSNLSRYSFYLLTRPDLPWVPDGLRDSPDRRDWFFMEMERELAENGLSYAIVDGDVGRFELAVQLLEAGVGLENPTRRA